jgi:hypothetical protein
MIANLATKTYSLFLATETQLDRYSKRLLVSILIDSGRGGRQGRVMALPLSLDATLEDEINKSINYVLGFAPVPSRDLEVNLVHSYSGSIDLPPGHSKVNLVQVTPIQNPATQPLKQYIRQNPM